MGSVDEVRRKGKKGVVFKLDDKVSWKFLSLVMEREIRREIEALDYGMPLYAHFVFGSPSRVVFFIYGIAQEDPLSPFLFTLVVDVLGRILERGVEISLVEGFKFGREELQLADDIILLLE